MKTVTKTQLSKLSSNQILSEGTATYENYRLKFLLLVYFSKSLTSVVIKLSKFAIFSFFSHLTTLATTRHDVAEVCTINYNFIT